MNPSSAAADLGVSTHILCATYRCQQHGRHTAEGTHSPPPHFVSMVALKPFSENVLLNLSPSGPLGRGLGRGHQAGARARKGPGGQMGQCQGWRGQQPTSTQGCEVSVEVGRSTRVSEFSHRGRFQAQLLWLRGLQGYSLVDSQLL